MNNDNTFSQLFTSLDLLEKVNGWLDTFVKQMSDLKTDFDINALENFADDLKTSKLEYLKLKNEAELVKNATSQLDNEFKNIDNLEIAENIITQSEIESKFETIYDNLKQQTSNEAESQDYKQFLESIGESKDLQILSQDFTIPTDPITLKEINSPVRNKKCNHVYDKESFLEMIKTRRIIKCPYRGCSNKSVVVDDVEEDSRLKILIDQHKASKQN